ncbi:uncharacterized protein [Haliotis asinina]|uniref:uncharacterized protein n=1 Tax=Haliotis asinina TaxID=109174 RepID=UPI0035320CCD
MAEGTTQVIDAELAQVRQRLVGIEGVKLEASVRELVRVSVYVTEQKQLTIHLMFPENYPHQPIVVELKSKSLSFKLLDGLCKMCDEEARKNVGQRQVVLMVMFVKTFLQDNPLCVCNEEISYIKRNLVSGEDKVILKQKTSQIVIKVKQGSYFMNLRVTVPNDYPVHQVQCEIEDCNFPPLLKTFFQAQAIEISRQCVQPPLKKKPKDPPFQPKPSLRPVCEFLIRDCCKRYPKEVCQLCKDNVLSEDPETQTREPKKRLERVYCGHLFHTGCLNTYMKTPPFIGGKKCPGCGCQIFHEKWKVSPELAEARWAHKQARQRELAEVVDFLE